MNETRSYLSIASTPSILVGLGANLSIADRTPRQTLEAALVAMPSYGINVCARSYWYRTPALTPHEQPDYINAIIKIETAHSSYALLDMLHRIENSFGRVRHMRWESRVIDLDLIDYRGFVIPVTGQWGPEGGNGARPLALPHPMIAARGFVLLPLRDVAPDWRHPLTGESVDRLLQALGSGSGYGTLAGITRLSD